MRRRAFVTGAGLTLAGVAAGGAGGGELFLLRRMKFEELGDAVVVSVALPELLPTRDASAMQSIESGFATTLRLEATVVRTKSLTPVARRVRIVKIQWNPWRERYVVQTTDQGRGAAIRYYGKRDAAIAHAITLERMRVARASALERGPSATYAVTIVGQRNPIDPESRVAADDGGGGQTRGGGDLSAFSRWIGVFVQSAPRAEKTFAVRSSPAFYLVTR
ncbi:MAG: DUF4390 domain-containing protein [Myxococcales bacterium]|nr:DUF4390 domain-containing protein [Myxococcales bacterium]MCB9752450.1 DUF4390 domain-containing protein [Myxococcales bacterium]